MEPLKIVAVCTGNICRSPLSEYILKDALDGAHFSISSAGTRAVRDGQVPEQQVKIAHKLGLDGIVTHRPRQMSVEQLQGAHLVLAASLRHRRRIVRTLPSASSHAFTMREFAHLAPYVNDSDLTELLEQGVPPLVVAAAAVHQLRGTVPIPPEEDAYDIVDPFGKDKKTYRISADQLVAAHQSIVEFLQRIERIAMASDSQSASVAPLASTPAPASEHNTGSSAPAFDSTAGDLVNAFAYSNGAPFSTPPMSAAVGHPARSSAQQAANPSNQWPPLNGREVPSFSVDNMPTLGEGIQLGLDKATPSRGSGKHAFNPTNPDHVESRRRVMSESRDLPVAKTDRGRHRRYST